LTRVLAGFDDDEAGRGAIERRWFALDRAAGRLRHECDGIAELLQATQHAWRDARSRLSDLEALRDALGEELSRQDTCRSGSPEGQARFFARTVSSGGGKSENVSRTRRAAST
jgi:hypothetical protein